eukprot:443314-Pelagomonas_calceolata.AAC.3
MIFSSAPATSCIVLEESAHLLAAWFVNRVMLDDTGPFYFSQARSEDVFRFFQNQNSETYHSIHEIVGFFTTPSSQAIWLKVKFLMYCDLVDFLWLAEIATSRLAQQPG